VLATYELCFVSTILRLKRHLARRTQAVLSQSFYQFFSLLVS